MKPETTKGMALVARIELINKIPNSFYSGWSLEWDENPLMAIWGRKWGILQNGLGASSL